MKSALNDPEFWALPAPVRSEVELWLRLLEPAVNCRPGRALLNPIAKTLDVGLATVYRKLRALKTYGWTGLINRAKFPSDPPIPSIDFRAFLHGLWLLNKKSYRATHKQLIAMWKGGAKIPGYTQRPETSRLRSHPDGWTYANFVYHIKKAKQNRPLIETSFAADKPQIIGYKECLAEAKDD